MQSTKVTSDGTDGSKQEPPFVQYGARCLYREGILKLLAGETKEPFVPLGVIAENGQIAPPASVKKQARRLPALPAPGPVPSAPKAGG
jgi:hypothetical protein